MEIYCALSRWHLRSWLGGVLFLMPLISEIAQARDRDRDRDEERESEGNYCSRTAADAYKACKFEGWDDEFIAKAKCANVNNEDEREDCFETTKEERSDKNSLCRAQRRERIKLCDALGESRYELDLSPALFESDYTKLTNPNPYYPLTIGNQWEYKGGSEIDVVEVSNETKSIGGIQCIVLKDRVTQFGLLHEDTDDWYCQAKNGDVYYLGEEVKNYETFEGDVPARAELVGVDGSFKHGRDNDKGGIISLSSPKVGTIYREEFALGNAEDSAEILSISYSYGENPELDRYVPQALAQTLCANDCVVTKNISQIEPGIVGRKYYAKGIGFFFEVNPDTGETLQLTNCNFDGRCTNLPLP